MKVKTKIPQFSILPHILLVLLIVFLSCTKETIKLSDMSPDRRDRERIEGSDEYYSVAYFKDFQTDYSAYRYKDIQCEITADIVDTSGKPMQIETVIFSAINTKNLTPERNRAEVFQDGSISFKLPSEFLEFNNLRVNVYYHGELAEVRMRNIKIHY